MPPDTPTSDSSLWNFNCYCRLAGDAQTLSQVPCPWFWRSAATCGQGAAQGQHSQDLPSLHPVLTGDVEYSPAPKLSLPLFPRKRQSLTSDFQENQLLLGQPDLVCHVLCLLRPWLRRERHPVIKGKQWLWGALLLDTKKEHGIWAEPS